ncbi:MAG: DUF3037 domain-containing protein [Verrucomicrobium sp.]
MSNSPQIVNYAILRYLPYVETGEFVNVAVVAHTLSPHWCGHAWADEDVERITHFFPSVKRELYQVQKSAFLAELNRVEKLIKITPDRRLSLSIFTELTRPRESLFRFGEIRTGIADEPASFTAQLCNDYVNPRLEPLVAG